MIPKKLRVYDLGPLGDWRYCVEPCPDGQWRAYRKHVCTGEMELIALTSGLGQAIDAGWGAMRQVRALSITSN